ncbi:MAG: hypothetical protein IJI12_03410 [Atopobiaceae bacterium]|nr:hypothetical protein [Atopobiaceae bacterium]
MPSLALAETIREPYGIVKKLEAAHPGRHFTLDGHLVGSLGEVYAAERYGLKLARASEKTHDGTAPDGRLVQIKVTQRKSIGIGSEPNYLNVLLISQEGEFEEIYNGPGNLVWNQVKDKPMPKNGQYQVSLSRLRKLNGQVSEKDRIQPVE